MQHTKLTGTLYLLLRDARITLAVNKTMLQYSIMNSPVIYAAETRTIDKEIMKIYTYWRDENSEIDDRKDKMR